MIPIVRGCSWIDALGMGKVCADGHRHSTDIQYSWTAAILTSLRLAQPRLVRLWSRKTIAHISNLANTWRYLDNFAEYIPQVLLRS